MMPDYDVVVMGAGPAGALVAAELGAAGRSVLVLEAGPAAGRTWADYQANVGHYLAAPAKVPNSPYATSADAPFPSVLDIEPLAPGGPPGDAGYFVQEGPLPFSSDYLRSAGGTTMHWLGTCLRMLPADFETGARYGVGGDWPLGYDELEPYYERAERELGVAGDVADQEYLGLRFREGYVYPMHRIPPSYGDRRFAELLDGVPVHLDGEDVPIVVSNTPQARNGVPNPEYDDGHGYEPVGAVGNPHSGLRCEGNSSCIPICPAQAKYNALKTLHRAQRGPVEVRTQAVVSRVVLSPDRRRVRALEYIPYDDGSLPAAPERVTAELFVLAGNAIENAKLLLMSGAANGSDQVGRNLMDHPFMMCWALMPESIGAFRGPSSTAGLEMLRDGPFRRRRAAFRAEIANWGWDFAAFAPYADVAEGVHGRGLSGPALRSWLARRIPRQIRLGFLLEQLPVPSNRVTLDRRTDGLGLPRPRLAYDVDTYTRRGMAAARECATQVFALLGAADATAYLPTDAGYVTLDGAGYTYHGSGHLVGTHRMGDDPATSVVDDRQRAWDHENLYVVGAGSSPTVATSNPTLTLTALALRAADGMLEDLGERP
jgi:choline dehydrogenase-like flavoprotein